MLDAVVLGRWLDANDAPGEGEEPVLEQLSGGSQNTLYLIHRGDHRMVLRMPGARADAARIDGLLREIRLVRALGGTDVPHAELIAANDAGDLLGMPFYVMQAIDGWSPMDGGWPSPFDDDLAARRGLAFQLVEGAAKLGRVDWQAQGLDGFGRPDGFHERQVDRWLAFLDSYKVRDLPGLDEAADWLRSNRPAHYKPGIMHGDYQFANVMFAHGEPARLAAIVDWEMTTVGDPLLDLAWCLLGYDGENPREDGFYLDMSGMPTRSELLERYEQVSGLSTENIDYYLVLANWKLGIVLEKTYAAGVRSGKVDPKIQGAFGAMVPQLIATAAEMAGSLPSVSHSNELCRQLFDLTGQTILITGGSRGLGREMAFGVARCGADVVIASRKMENCVAVAEQIESETGRTAMPYQVHVGRWDQLDGLVDAVYDRFGKVDTLINNAGMSPVYDKLTDVTEKLFDAVVNLNLKGPFRLSALVGERMVAAGRGSIINVSTAGSLRPTPDIIPYASSKAGLNAMTEGFARALGPKVRVNTLMAGPFLTDVSKSWNLDQAAHNPFASLSLQRAGDPAEIVGAALFLASDASSFTTGSIVRADGGIP